MKPLHLRKKNIFRYSLLLLIGLTILLSYKFLNINIITNLIDIQEDKTFGQIVLIGLLIFLLRIISIVIPIIPGTYCAVLAGYFYGVKIGLGIVFLADIISCSTSFWIARNLGREFISKILGSRQMQKVENISKKYLERNFFLMTGFLMTSWFDFVCYAVGLTKIPWNKFMPALILSILISDTPFVAGGYTIGKLKDVSITQVLNGEIEILSGGYLFLLISSALILFGLGILNIFINKNQRLST